MIPYSYKFVDFRGTDLSTINGLTVDGIYNDIVTALNRCGEVVLYNWFFASIPIAPSYCSIEVENGHLTINDIIEIREDDTVWVESLIPDPPTLVPLSVSENGQFSPLDYDADGFSGVDVDVPERVPVVEELLVTENGEYTPGVGVDGFNKVTVNVETAEVNFISTTQGDYLTGWYSNRTVRRVLSTGDKLIASIYLINSGYSSGCFCTLKDYGEVGNVVSGDYTSKVTIEGMTFPDEIVRPIYIYGGMRGGGNHGTVALNLAGGIGGNIRISLGANLSPDGTYAPTSAENYGNPWQQMSDDSKRNFLNLLLLTLD